MRVLLVLNRQGVLIICRKERLELFQNLVTRERISNFNFCEVLAIQIVKKNKVLKKLFSLTVENQCQSNQNMAHKLKIMKNGILSIICLNLQTEQQTQFT